MFVVRDPVNRFLSGFASRQNQGAPAHSVPWTPAEKIAFERFPDAESLAIALDERHDRHTEAQEAMQAVSHLSCSYWDWFGDITSLEERRASILFIGNLENLTEDFGILQRAIGLPSDAQLPSDPRLANRSHASRAAKLSSDAHRNLQDWYAADYEFLEWCRKWRSEQSGPVNRQVMSLSDAA